MQALDIRIVNSLKSNVESSIDNDDIGSHIDYLAELATDKDILEGNCEMEGNNDENEFE